MALLCLAAGLGAVTIAIAGSQVRCGKEGAYYGASLERALAQRLIAAGDGRAANDAARRGLETLGSAYASRDMIDDTGLHLALAYGPERAGDFRRAAAIRLGILTERLKIFRDNHGRLTCALKVDGN